MLIDVIECVCILIITFIMSCFAGLALYNIFHMDAETLAEIEKEIDEAWVNSKRHL